MTGDRAEAPEHAVPPSAQSWPHTRTSLAADLRALGLASGDTVVVHSSYRSLGFVVGGPQAVVEALLDVVGVEGTLLVPTHTSDNSEPADWRHPAVPESWWPVIRDESSGFDPQRTPSRWMGLVAETVRTWPGAVRSGHPAVSMAAVGARARELTETHRCDDALGETSPLGALYRLGGLVLLLGVGHESNTSLHLAEWRQPDPPRAERGASVRRPDGTSEWVTWTDVAEDESDFPALGQAFDASGGVARGRVGNAEARLMSQRRLVDFATHWLATHRGTPA